MFLFKTGIKNYYFRLGFPKFLTIYKVTYKRTYDYEVTFLRQNGISVTKKYTFMPRIVEFPDYVDIPIKNYIGLHNGFGWVISDVKILTYNYCSLEIIY